MAQISQITLADGQTDPASHVFNPTLPQQGSTPAQWVNAESETLVGNRKVTLRVSERQNKYEVEVRVSDPVLSVVNDTCCDIQNVPAVAYTNTFSGTFTIAKSATKQNRKDILAYAKSILAVAAVHSAVEDLEQVW